MSDVLITAWSRVQVLAGPPKKHEILRLVLFFCLSELILIQFSAYLFPNLIKPSVINLCVNRKGRAGLCVSCFGGNSCHTDVWIGQQDTDERMPEHMRVKSLNPGTVSDSPYLRRFCPSRRLPS